MLGAIAGDVIGSVHERAGTKTKDFPLFVDHSQFTDDTVLTVAVADRPASTLPASFAAAAWPWTAALALARTPAAATLS